MSTTVERGWSRVHHHRPLHSHRRIRVLEWGPLRFVTGVVYLTVGIAFVLQSAGVWTVRVVDLWPLAFMAVGVAVLLGRAKRVRVEEDRSSQLAVAEERVRIARELHDIVAHSLSLMTVQIAAARRVQRSQPQAADEALAAAEDAGRQSLAELRGVLASLRGADASLAAANPGRVAPEGDPGAGRRPLPGLSDLETLVAGARSAGLAVTLSIVGAPPRAAPGVGLVVYRVVQEALTNAIRYAGPAHVSVEVTYSPREIVVFVDDDGSGSDGRAGEGHGILGMRERVRAVGGVLDAGPRAPGPGWRVHARIPLSEFSV
jgi:signal transduction histidine kinase